MMDIDIVSVYLLLSDSLTHSLAVICGGQS